MRRIRADRSSSRASRSLSVIVFSYPIDSGRLASFLSLEAFTQALGVKQQTHQGIEPLSQPLACHQCETLKLGCHGLQSSRRRAVCRSRVISNRHPFARPALPGVNATMDGSDFHASPPVFSLSTLVHGCPPPADRYMDLPGYHKFSMSGSTRPRTPGSTRVARRYATPIVACRGAKPVGTLQRQNFRGSTPSGSAPPVTFAPRLLSYLRIDAPVTSRAARLDTGLVEHDYPGGTPTR